MSIEKVDRPEGDTHLIKVNVNEDDTCDVMIADPITTEHAAALQQAVGKVMVGMAQVLSKKEYTCGHIACIFNALIGVCLDELHKQFPDDFKEAIAQKIGQHDFMTKHRSDGEPIH